MILTAQGPSIASIRMNAPSTLWFGCGERHPLPGRLKELNCRRVWILAGRSAAEAADSMAAEIRRNGMEARVSTGIPAEPTVEDFETACREPAATDCDTVIGIGGGSVLDVAKLAAAIGDSPDRLGDYFGKDLLPDRRRRLVCLPTTAGAGSEASPNAILLDPVSQLKQAVISPYLVPDLAVIDPELACSLPPAITAATGFDALSHCIEAYTNRHAHPLVDAFALQGISLIAANLVAAVRDGSDISARSALALGSYLGGLCLGPVNTAAVHALSYPVGSRYKVPHGLANALLLSPVMRFNIPSAPRRYADIARAMAIDMDGPDEVVAEAAVSHLEDLARACSLETGLGQLGIPADSIPELADQALKVTRLLNNNPRPIDREDAISIYRKAF